MHLANDSVELTLTTAFGPRIRHFGPLGGPNLFWVQHDAAQDDGVWHSYGGHRLWRAPEDRETTYVPDNVSVSVHGDAQRATVSTPADRYGIAKRIDVALAGAGVELTHTLVNQSSESVRLACWALTCMAPGGVAEVPRPPERSHLEALLPDRRVVLWPYTDPADTRISWARGGIAIRQGGPDSLKVGFGSPVAELSYTLAGWRFTKTTSWDAEAVYPDLGCNLEVYTNAEMLELETLSPLVTLEPGETATHLERWSLEPA